MRALLEESPVGPLTLTAEEGFLTGCAFGAFDLGEAGENAADAAVLALCQQEPAAYFAGKLQNFTVPLRPAGTAFRQRVWEALCRIPYGQTASYRNIAERVGNPKAVRAVGGANHHNPIVILIPCHRVIGSDGSLTGFGGGLEAKKFLLGLEAGQ